MRKETDDYSMLAEDRFRELLPCCRIFDVPHAEHRLLCFRLLCFRLLCFRLLRDAFAGNAPGSAPFR